MLQRVTMFVLRLRRKASEGFFKEFIRFASSSSILQASRLASALVVAAILGPGDWGNWYLLNLVIAYGALAQLGALNGMNREVPAARGAGRDSEAVQLRTTTLGILLIATGVAVAGLLIASFVFPAFHLSGEFLLTLLLLMATQLYSYATTSLRSTTNFRDLSRLQGVEAAVYPITAIGGSLLFGLPGFIVGQIITALLCSYVANRARTVVWRPSLSFAVGKHLISVGFPIMLVGLTYTMLTTVDRWVVTGFLGSEALGHYSIAILAMSAVGFLPNVISQQFYPRIAFQWSANRDTAELRKLAASQRTYTFGVVLPVVALMALLAPPVIRNLLPEYAPGIPAILITALAPLISTIGQGYGAVLHVLDRQYWYLGAIVASIIVNVAASLLLVQSMGLVGVALATLAAFAVLAAFRVWLGGLALRRAAQ